MLSTIAAPSVQLPGAGLIPV
ncbi:MAG: hypothetical protein K0Q86_1213, partial [Arthrobacter koreensis]|nr:hypothetical protein [Arthrobacter koreensis]